MPGRMFSVTLKWNLNLNKYRYLICLGSYTTYSLYNKVDYNNINTYIDNATWLGFPVWNPYVVQKLPSHRLCLTHTFRRMFVGWQVRGFEISLELLVHVS